MSVEANRKHSKSQQINVHNIEKIKALSNLINTVATI